MNRILLIEDDAGAQLLFKNRLEDLSYEVVVASTGARGLLEARAGSFDLFLVDIELGSGIDGYEVCSRLKAIPAIHSTPVVLISGRVKGQEDLHRGYEAGCEAYLLKGDITLMEDVVRAMCRIKSLQDDLALQNRLLEDQNRRLQTERQRGADLKQALVESGGREMVLRELAAGRPDAALLVDGDGVVRQVNRGAQDLFGKEVEGRHLASLAPESGLEAFVRDARSNPHEAYRFTLPERGGRAGRALSASVMPLVPSQGAEMDLFKIVLLVDSSKRRVASEIMRLEDQGFPRRELGALVEAARGTYRPSAILGENPVMVDLRARIAQASNVDSPALLRGEAGTGKKFIARVMHYFSGTTGPFIPVHCGALRDQQLESELFGHDKSAFPEAVMDHPGAFEEARHGTVLLEEVHELPDSLQAKLLQVLEKGHSTRAGSQKGHRVEVRILASSSADLHALVEQGKFRKDLLYQLGRLELHVPALRDREEDVEILSEHFLRRFGATRSINSIAADAVWVLSNHDWPGNVRELENAIESACALANGDEITISDLPQPFAELARRLEGREASDTIPRISKAFGVSAVGARGEATEGEDSLRLILGEDHEPSLKAWEKVGLMDAMRRTEGDKLAAAKLLGVGKSTFYRKLKSHDLT
ncbi:MAG: DNA-binding NtrC family response regulator [Planctomycetota bacterium]|jgi:DNA-binding NtrC family response regulator